MKNKLTNFWRASYALLTPFLSIVLVNLIVLVLSILLVNKLTGEPLNLSPVTPTLACFLGCMLYYASKNVYIYKLEEEAIQKMSPIYNCFDKALRADDSLTITVPKAFAGNQGFLIAQALQQMTAYTMAQLIIQWNSSKANQELETILLQESAAFLSFWTTVKYQHNKKKKILGFLFSTASSEYTRQLKHNPNHYLNLYSKYIPTLKTKKRDESIKKILTN